MPTPNIVVICCDEQRADSLAAYGNPICRTPHLDRLAEQGTLFTRCYSQNPVCMPERASLISGNYSRHTGVFANSATMPRDVPTLPDLLAEQGYATAAFGKLHLGSQHDGWAEAPHYGFQHLVNVEDNSLGPYLDWALANFPEYEGYLVGTLFNLPPHDAYWQGKRDFRKEVMAAREQFVKPLEISDTCNWGFVHNSPLPPAAHKNTFIADRAIDYLRAADRAQPQFLWVSFVDPHPPIDPPKAFRDLYDPDTVDARIRQEGEEAGWSPHHRAMYENYYRPFTERDWRVMRAQYYGSVTFMDEQIGRVISALESTLDMENTLVVFTADHGEILGDHGICGKTAYHYDSCIRVPLIGRWDGHWRAGLRTDEITEHIGLAATLLDAAGLPNHAVMDGPSFAPLLTGEPLANPRGCAYIESYSGGPEDPTPAPQTWARTIRTDRYRATFYPDASHGELFDMQEDPQELRNLWGDPAYREVIDAHRNLLLERLILMDYPVRNRRAAV